MVLQYKLKGSKSKWKDYPKTSKKFLSHKVQKKKELHGNGKNKLEKSVSYYDFRLLNHDKKKILVKNGTYTAVMKRMRQIEFFKHK